MFRQGGTLPVSKRMRRLVVEQTWTVLQNSAQGGLTLFRSKTLQEIRQIPSNHLSPRPNVPEPLARPPGNFLFSR
jgi:hypothetical protein